MSSVVAETRARLLRLKQDQEAANEVGGIEAELSAVIRDPSINDVGLFERLRRKVGLGDDPKKRRAFFDRLVKLHQTNPDLVESIIAEAWAQSVGARRRDRYFCKSVTQKLAENHGAVTRLGTGVDDVI